MSSVILHVPMDVPDEALRRLTSMGLAALRRTSDARVIEVFWDNARQEWNVVTREVQSLPGWWSAAASSRHFHVEP
ncbi:hypothetical protein ACFWN5_19870 [Streptomyces sp. NPDC058430]|uniref:hypothetical protein n=1 Tax=Streptomyces sp. NPDC058430 TaxID=3346495 RepID=UPI0036507E83